MAANRTIFALSSARGRAGVAVFRISGPNARSALLELTRKPPAKPRQAVLRSVFDHQGQLLDKGLVIWFEGPESFTGEDVAEIHLHGGPAIIAAMIARLGAIVGLEPAGPGEFTRQAFEHGKFDLTEAEGLADLIAAETEAQRRQALNQLQGSLKAKYEDWRSALIKAGAHVAACIDFADEEIPDGLIDGVVKNVTALQSSIREHMADSRRGEIIRDGFCVVILGAPNVGKSSLLNAIAKRNVAIVSDTPGTTRDLVEVHLNLGGYPVTLIDTAGLRESADGIEREGMKRATEKAAAADLRLAVVAYSGDGVDSRVTAHLSAHDALLINKVDLGKAVVLPPSLQSVRTFSLSAKTGEGVTAFLDWLQAEVEARIGGSESAPMTRERHRLAIQQTSIALDRFLARAAKREPALDMLSEDLRSASEALGRITGRIGVEDYLDVIFKEFCIGK